MKTCDTRELLAITGGLGWVGGGWAASNAAICLYTGVNKKHCRAVAGPATYQTHSVTDRPNSLIPVDVPDSGVCEAQTAETCPLVSFRPDVTALAHLVLAVRTDARPCHPVGREHSDVRLGHGRFTVQAGRHTSSSSRRVIRVRSPPGPAGVASRTRRSVRPVRCSRRRPRRRRRQRPSRRQPCGGFSPRARRR